MKTHLIFILMLCIGLFAAAGHATGPRPAEINVGYFQHWPTPSLFSQLKKTYSAALGLEVTWIPFASGAEMNDALQSGRIQIAHSHGLVPFLTGVSRGLDITMVGVAVGYSGNDNCVLRDDAGITRANAKQLEGQKIATVFGGVTHYRLLKILEQLGIDQSRVEILPMGDAAAAAKALRQGDVVMACAYGSALRDMNAIGSPLLSGAELDALGLRVFDAISVATAFMQENPQIVQTFMDVTEASNVQWRKNPEPMRSAIARAADMDIASSNQTLDMFSFPSAAEQKSKAWMGGTLPRYTKEIADFFVAQGRLGKALDNYDRFITTRFLR